MTTERVTIDAAGSLGGERAARLLDVLDDLDALANRRIAKVETDSARYLRDRLQEAVMPDLVDALERYFIGLADRLGAGRIVRKAAPFYETIDWSNEANLLKQTMTPALDKMYVGGYHVGIALPAAIPSVIDDANKFSLAGSLTLADYDLSMTDRLGERIVQINETTRAKVSSIVARGVEQGLAPRDIARGTKEFDGIRSYVAETYKNRARTIALTETASAYNLGSLNGYKDVAVEKVRIFDGDDCGWSAHDDSDAAAGSVRTLEEAESQPTAHPNCQRSWSPYFASEEQTTASAQGTSNAPNASEYSLPPTPSPTVGQPPPSPQPTATQVSQTPSPVPGEYKPIPGVDALDNVDSGTASAWARGWQGDIKAAVTDARLAGQQGYDDLIEYTGAGHRRINSAYRGTWEQTFAEKPTAAQLRTHIEAGERISAQAMKPLPANVKVYRGVQVDAFGLAHNATKETVLNTIKPGARFFEDGFTSTSVSRGASFQSKAPNNVRLVVEAPKGTKAAYVDDISRNSGELELVLDKGQEYVVKSVTARDAHGAAYGSYFDVVVQVVPSA